MQISDAFAVIRVAYLKLLFRVSEISSLAKCVLTILELNCHELFGDVTKKIKICQVLMLSTQLQIRSFHVVDWTKTVEKCTKEKSASLKMQICYDFVGKAL